MKKIIKRIFLCLLVIILVAVGAGAYVIFHDPDKGDTKNKPYVTDAMGSTYLAVVDDKGITYAVVTDADGNRYAAKYDGSTVGETIGQINDQVAKDDLPTNYTGPNINVTVNTNNYTGTPSTTLPTTSSQGSSSQAPSASGEKTTNQKPDTSNTAPSNQKDPYALEPYRIEKYMNIFKGGTFLMEITTNDPDMGDTPITMAVKNGNMYIDVTIEGMKCRLIYNKSKDTTYMVLDDIKKYCKIPSSMMGEDMDISKMMEDFSKANTDVGEISVSEVNLNGQKLILESYNNPEDGSTVNYYFDGDTLVRMDQINRDGSVDTQYYSRFTTDVPDSYFEIPSGYGYINLSLLESFM